MVGVVMMFSSVSEISLSRSVSFLDWICSCRYCNSCLPSKTAMDGYFMAKRIKPMKIIRNRPGSTKMAIELVTGLTHAITVIQIVKKIKAVRTLLNIPPFCETAVTLFAISTIC